MGMLIYDYSDAINITECMTYYGIHTLIVILELYTEIKRS